MSGATATLASQQQGWNIKPSPRVFSGHESFACRYGWLPKLF